MSLLHAARRRWIVLWVVVALFAVSLHPVQPAAAADSSLVLAALKVLDEEYVDPIQPVPLLNAAIAALRKVTNQNSAVLPDIPSGTTRADAEVAFTVAFVRALPLSPVS